MRLGESSVWLVCGARRCRVLLCIGRTKQPITKDSLKMPGSSAFLDVYNPAHTEKRGKAHHQSIDKLSG